MVTCKLHHVFCFFIVGSERVGITANQLPCKMLQGGFVLDGFVKIGGGANIRRACVIQPVAGYFMPGVECRHFIRFYLADIQLSVQPADPAGLAQKTGVQIKSAADAVAVHDLYQTAVMNGSVIITHGKGFAFSVGEYDFVKQCSFSFHGALPVVCCFNIIISLLRGNLFCGYT